MLAASRRQALLALAAGLLVGGEAKPLRLTKAGAPRRLAGKMFGSAMMPMLENFYEPAKIQALARLNLAYTRFPGGSMSSFYNWRTGQLDVDAQADSSPYRKAWGQRSLDMRRRRPEGWRFPEYAGFCRKVGVEPLLLPNLETRTAEDQAEWMKSLKQQGLSPRHLELGNEFFLGLENDPASIRRFPDAAAAQAITRTYVEAMGPYLRKDVKLAICCADEGFAGQRAGADAAYTQRIAEWNDGLKAAQWFDAVTIHTIANVSQLGAAAAQPATTAKEARRLFDLLMAHWDEGVRRSTARLADRFPGKEVWMTEWNPRQGVPLQGSDIVTMSMEMHAMVRCHLAMLQTPAVALSSFQLMSFDQAGPYRTFAPDGEGGWSPYPVAMALGWLASAVNVGGAQYQRWVEEEAEIRQGGGKFDDRYAVVEAAMFERAGRATLIVQNAGPESRLVEVSLIGRHGVPTLAESLTLPDLLQEGRLPAAPHPLDARASTVSLPPYSVTRLVWA